VRTSSALTAHRTWGLSSLNAVSCVLCGRGCGVARCGVCRISERIVLELRASFRPPASSPSAPSSATAAVSGEAHAKATAAARAAGDTYFNPLDWTLTSPAAERLSAELKRDSADADDADDGADELRRARDPFYGPPRNALGRPLSADDDVLGTARSTEAPARGQYPDRNAVPAAKSPSRWTGTLPAATSRAAAAAAAAVPASDAAAGGAAEWVMDPNPVGLDSSA
jgi:hypothetical protein